MRALFIWSCFFPVSCLITNYIHKNIFPLTIDWILFLIFIQMAILYIFISPKKNNKRKKGYY